VLCFQIQFTLNGTWDYQLKGTMARHIMIQQLFMTWRTSGRSNSCWFMEMRMIMFITNSQWYSLVLWNKMMFSFINWWGLYNLCIFNEPVRSLIITKFICMKFYFIQSYPDENHSIGSVRRHLYHSLERFLFDECFKTSSPADPNPGDDDSAAASLSKPINVAAISLLYVVYRIVFEV